MITTHDTIQSFYQPLYIVEQLTGLNTPCGTARLVTGSPPPKVVYTTRDVTRVRSSNPGWRSRIQSGVSATGFYVREETRVQKQTGNITVGYNITSACPGDPTSDFRKGQNHFMLSGNFGDFSFVLHSFNMAALRVKASQAASAALYQKASQARAMALVTLAERKETLDMIRGKSEGLMSSIASYVSTATNFLRKRRFSPKRPSSPKARKKYDAASVRRLRALYLEHAYGWAPLIGEIGDLADAYNRLGKPPRMTVSATGQSEESHTSSTTSVSTYSGYLRYNTYTQYTGKVMVYLRGAIDVSDESSPVQDLRSLGVTPDNWAPSLWEVIPYSFVIDYFTNVGSVIENVSLRASVNWAWACNSTVLTNTAKRFYLANPAAYSDLGSGVFVHLDHEPDLVEYYRFDRTSSVDFPLDVGIKLPSIKQALNVAVLASLCDSSRRTLKSLY